jgi:hypothetical protein
MRQTNAAFSALAIPARLQNIGLGFTSCPRHARRRTPTTLRPRDPCFHYSQWQKFRQEDVIVSEKRAYRKTICLMIAIAFHTNDDLTPLPIPAASTAAACL